MRHIYERLASRYPKLAATLQNYNQRAILFFSFGIVVSFAFAIFNGILAGLKGSIWHGTLAGYVIALAFLKFTALLFGWRAKDNESKKRVCDLVVGCSLIALIIPLGISMFYRLRMSLAPSTGLAVAIATALYTFIRMGTAIYHIVRAKKSDSVVYCLKCINFSDALVSMFALTITLLTAVGSVDQDMQLLANCLAIGVIIGVTVIGLGLIVHFIRDRKKEIKNGTAGI